MVYPNRFFLMTTSLNVFNFIAIYYYRVLATPVSSTYLTPQIVAKNLGQFSVASGRTSLYNQRIDLSCL